MIGEWPLVVADFASEYGIRLHAVEFFAWREFRPLLAGLFAADTRLHRRFAPEPDQSDQS